MRIVCVRPHPGAFAGFPRQGKHHHAAIGKLIEIDAPLESDVTGKHRHNIGDGFLVGTSAICCKLLAPCTVVRCIFARRRLFLADGLEKGFRLILLLVV